MAKKQGQLIDVDLDGKIIDTTNVLVSVPEVVKDVEIHKLDNDDFRLVKGDCKGTGKTMDEALRAFKKKYKEN
jgi:hypothetical protein